MLLREAPERATTKTPGRLSRALLRMLMKQATVVASEPLSDRFALITLEGKALQDVTWVPGQKIQIAMGSAFVARTYTPMDWNTVAGRTRILAFTHGEGPGSAWVRNVRPGDVCDLFGPRSSLDVRQTTGPLAVFGDETSIGLAYALLRQDRTRSVMCHFEVGDREGASQLLEKLEIGPAALFERQGNGTHILEMEAALQAQVDDGATFALTGQAGTIQRLRQGLKRQEVPAARILTKAYWAPGKTGLD
ncbi:siderophore-interacting protein [Methylocella sp. CPCC 101449]|uniref:siderophore-interacting protein n=1 Tax=Methylocella sp. CPCC 101449 TaxID=2987531 RepID=UPI00288FAF69|nr:siderophore-interacting protein [Methylocella sp. CPCC 101449]MDT2021728.1 siderophore-interacting protein [Methylocella sp. CPCC 101449]